MHVTAIIAAGGRGVRFGATAPKQLAVVGGVPILQRSVEAFMRHPSIDAVIVAVPEALAAAPPDYLRGDGRKRLAVVAGGERRQDSVANAFRVADPATDVIVIHDGARPFVSADLIARTIAAAAESGAALAAVQARDTVKRANVPATSAVSTVAETIPRETIYLAQTPQAFQRRVLADALALASDATDEAALAERAGHSVRLVDGEAANIKITTPDDLAIAEAIAGRHHAPSALPARTGRAGTGYDLHRLVEGRPLFLAGIAIPCDRGALGHSDADVVCHAVTDAILGAAALGDIGGHFPDSDPRWKDANSIELLRRVVALVAAQGLGVGNVDVTIVLERPKIKDHVAEMRASLAAALDLDVSRVSIKGKTNEGVDAIGRGEAIAAYAIALLRACPTQLPALRQQPAALRPQPSAPSAQP